jgi:hypothetical protein
MKHIGFKHQWESKQISDNKEFFKLFNSIFNGVLTLLNQRRDFISSRPNKLQKSQNVQQVSKFQKNSK